MSAKKISFLICFTFLCTGIIFPQVNSPRGALKDKNGNPMRGTPMVLGKGIPKSVEFAGNIENWKLIQNNGFNTIRLCWVDPYYKDRGRDHWKPEEVLPHLDRVVENATQTGMNLIINLHNVGGQQRYDTTYKFDQEKEFWKLVAPRYRDNDLVYYEPANEPTFRANDYLKPEWRKSYLELYELIRTLAPDRQILMFSFNNCSEGIIKAVEAYRDDLDWQYTTIAYHMYGSPTSEYVRELMKDYTVICTEWWYHHKSELPGNSFVRQVDGFKENSQTLENIGSGWTDWRDWGDVTLNELLDTLIIDAKSKNYWWGRNVKDLRATGISISHEKIELSPGESRHIYAYPLPALAENQKVTWKSSDKSILKVDRNGRITAVQGRTGTATITATTRDGGFTGTCTVDVRKKGELVVSVMEMKGKGPGWGHALVIQTPGGKTYLYDTGSNYPRGEFDAGKDMIAPFLESNEVKEIDGIVISHSHNDHFGGIQYLIKNYSIKKLWDNGYPYPGGDPEYDSIYKPEYIRNGGVYKVIKQGDFLDWDEDLEVRVLSPPADYITDTSSYEDPAVHHNPNLNSVVLRIRHKDNVFLFTGDINLAGQEYLVRRFGSEVLKCNVLCEGHGGANEIFASVTRPDIVAGSCLNGVESPVKTTEKIYSAVGSKVYATCWNGIVRIVSDGKICKVFTQRESGTYQLVYDKDQRLYVPAVSK